MIYSFTLTNISLINNLVDAVILFMITEFVFYVLFVVFFFCNCFKRFPLFNIVHLENAGISADTIIYKMYYLFLSA